MMIKNHSKITYFVRELNGIKRTKNHFEKNPARMMAKVTTKTDTWKNTEIMRLHIDQITGNVRRPRKISKKKTVKKPSENLIINRLSPQYFVKYGIETNPVCYIRPIILSIG